MNHDTNATAHDATPTPGNPMDNGEADLQWTHAQDAELRRLYPDEWIVVVNQKVVAHGAKLVDVKRAFDALNIDAVPFVEYVSSDNSPQILALSVNEPTPGAPNTVICNVCGGSGRVKCYRCKHGYFTNSWGDQEMCDCDELFERECKHCKGTGSLEVATPLSEPTPGASDALAGIIERLDAIGGDEHWDTRPAPRGHGGDYVEVANTNGTLIALVYCIDDADFIVHAPDDMANLIALIDAQTERVAALERAILSLEPYVKAVEAATAPTRETSAPSDTEWNAHLPHPDGWVNPLPHALNVSGRTIHGGPVMIRGDGLDFDGKPLTPPAPDAGATAAKLTRLTKAQWEMVNTLKSGAILRRHWASRTYRNGGERGIPSNVWGKLLKAGLIQEERVGDWFHASLTDLGRRALADATPNGGER